MPLFPQPMTDPQPRTYTLAASWFLFAKLLLAFARQINAMEKTGARGAVRKAQMLDAFAQVILFEVLRVQGETRALPESPKRDALVRQLDVTAYALVGLRLLAWNFQHGRAARTDLLGGLALDVSLCDAPFLMGPVYAPGFIDTN